LDVTAVYPVLDANHLVQWDLDEQIADLWPLDPLLGTLDGSNTPPQWAKYLPFVDAVAGHNLTLWDSYPQSASSKFFEIGAPGPFGGSVIFKGGTGTIERDYLYGSAVPEPTAITIDLWIRPFGTVSAANLIQKEYSGTTWVDPYTSVQIFQHAGSTEWGVSVTVGGARYFIDPIGHGNSAAPYQLIFGVWNHVGLTFDGATLKAYINGIFAGSTTVAGAIDYGTHGAWVLGGSRLIGSAGLDAANGNIGRTRISDVARPLSYFFNSYQGAVVGVSGAVGSGDLVLAPPPITIVGRGPGGLGMRLD
jgi:hypothetical protein